MRTFEEHVDELSEAILSAREFCGSEQEAVSEYLAEHGFPPRRVVSPERDRVVEHASMRAAEEWQRRRIEARSG